jgi:hypothetical protein
MLLLAQGHMPFLPPWFYQQVGMLAKDMPTPWALIIIQHPVMV